MTKVKSTGKFHYELLYIIPNKFTQQEAEEIDGKVRKGIEDRQGEIIYSEKWGNKKMAYPIKHYTHGYYYLLEFDMPGENLQEMNYWLKMYENVLRFQIVKKKKKTAEELEKEKRTSRIKTEKSEKEEESVKEKEDTDGKDVKDEKEKEDVKKSEVKEVKEEEVKEDKKNKEEAKEENVQNEKEEIKEEDGKKKKASQKKKEDKDKDKADLEDLDKKLDDILDSHDLL
jgi:ribosomal protein S6